MKFYYQPVLSASPETNAQHYVLRPAVPLLIHGTNDSALCTALVDTGSDNTILPKSVADYLGIPLNECLGPSPIAFGGRRLETYFGDVQLQLSDGKDSCDWRTRVLFHEAEDETVVLGHVGFLSFFTATFHGESGTLELVPNAALPAS